MAKVRIKENNNSGAKLKLEIKSEGSKLTKRIAISAIFFEDNFKVSSKAGTYQTEENNPLNAYYVQAGSCVNINILHKKIMDKNIIQVFTGPLLDNFNNLIADGTLVTFYYQNDYTSTITATTLSGYAQVEIPFSKGLTIYAQINQLKSNLLKIK